MTGRRLPDLLRVLCTLDGAPVPGAWVGVSLGRTYKNPFRLAFGPADATGTVEVSRDRLIGEAHKERELALMDYGGEEVHWDGRILVEVWNRARIDRALEAARQWGSLGRYPNRYEESLRTGRRQLERAANGRLVAHVDVVSPGSADVVVGEQAA